MENKFILVVASTNACKMDFFDTSTGTRVGRITDLVATPHEIWPDVERRLVYMASTYRTGAYGSTDRSHEVSVISVDEHRVVDVIDISPFNAPHDIEYSPVNDLIYVSVEPNARGDNGVVIIDPRSRRVVGNVPTPAPNSHWITITPDGSHCYVAHKESPSISVISLGEGAVVDSIDLPGGTEEIAVSPDGRSVYVATPTTFDTVPLSVEEASARTVGTRPNAVVKIDTATNEIVASKEVEPHISGLHVTASGAVLVSQLVRKGDALTQSDLRSGDVSLLDGDSLELLATAQLQRMPFTSRSTPDASTAFVANLGSGTISVLELPSLAVIDTWVSTPPQGPGPGGSHGLALLPA